MAVPEAPLPFPANRRIDIQLAKIAIDQGKSPWIYHPAPQEGHIGEQKHAEITRWQLRGIVEMPQGLIVRRQRLWDRSWPGSCFTTRLSARLL